MRAVRLLPIAAALLVLVALGGCVETGDATQPTSLRHLVVTPNGIEDLRIGQPVVLTDLVSFGEHACSSTGGWLPRFPKDANNAGGQQLDPFDIVTRDGSAAGSITTEFVWSRSIRTSTGIHVGSRESSVVKAYPHAMIDAFGSTDLYVISGGLGKLVLEVAVNNQFGVRFWPKNLLGRVLWMDVIPSSVDPRSIAYTSDAGPCPANAVVPDVVKH